ncbi:MAG TPA: YdcF family protein [Bryobacteraceae bacterium]|nr:YdcF family protein [Bryobacteraceae bacterium]
MSYAQPILGVCLLIALIGLVRLRRCPGSRLSLAGVLAVGLAAWPPVDWLLSRPLEVWYPVRPFPAKSAEAIVVLSAGVKPPVFERPYALVDQETFERVQYAAWLYSHWQPLPLLLCGGREDGGGPAIFSAAMRDQLRATAVPENMIWTEDRSRSTRENATYGAEILRAHGIRRIALVVDAQSMPRAAACFQKVGITVVPAPSGFREWGPFFQEIVPSWKAIRHNEGTLHETLGLAWYWLRGWI